MDGSWESRPGPEADAGLGRVALRPDEDILAGSVGTWQLTYTAGEDGIRVGGGLRLSTDTDTDWGIPQVTDPTAAEYLTVTAPEGVHVRG